jgi:cellulose synthase/poly-beta-1,6-N-acetylglucosamine synthase-like glycosyltransferase
MILLGSLLMFIYVATLLSLFVGYQKIKSFNYVKNDPIIKFSILIPFRNEAENLPKLLDSIANINYPSTNFELIFIDDESTDPSVEIINNDVRFVNYRIIKNIRISGSPKKDALTEAIKISKYEWIVSTDADCILPENWLHIFNQFILEKNPNMIAGPVSFHNKNGLINAYQQLDNASLQTVTIGGFGFQKPLMCNGANLVYRKDVFKKLSGFSGNTEIASGDDIFLMEKFVKKDKNKVLFLKNKDSLVITAAQNSWKNIINQRVRWASKTSKQKNETTQFIGLVVLLTNLYLIFGVLFSVFNLSNLKIIIGFLITKLISDFIFNSNSIRFLNYKISTKNYLLSFLMYPIITVFVFLKSLTGSYIWKGRTFKK